MSWADDALPVGDETGLGCDIFCGDFGSSVDGCGADDGDGADDGCGLVDGCFVVEEKRASGNSHKFGLLQSTTVSASSWFLRLGLRCVVSMVFHIR